jgi:hypothetical protein
MTESKTALDLRGFCEGEKIDLLDWAEANPGYFSESLVETLRKAKQKPAISYIVRVTSVTRAK